MDVVHCLRHKLDVTFRKFNLLPSSRTSNIMKQCCSVCSRGKDYLALINLTREFIILFYLMAEVTASPWNVVYGSGVASTGWTDMRKHFYTESKSIEQYYGVCMQTDWRMLVFIKFILKDIWFYTPVKTELSDSYRIIYHFLRQC
jgi:hypothetical protein